MAGAMATWHAGMTRCVLQMVVVSSRLQYVSKGAEQGNLVVANNLGQARKRQETPEGALLLLLMSLCLKACDMMATSTWFTVGEYDFPRKVADLLNNISQWLSETV